jgi:hypothetical protein
VFQAIVDALGGSEGDIYGHYQTFTDVFGASSSSSCPLDLPQIKVESAQSNENIEVHAIIRDRQKKDNHNMSE